MNLTEFLLARIAEDEDRVRREQTLRDEDAYPNYWTSPDASEWERAITPARVLAECEAKRAIIDRLRHVEAGVLLVGGDMTNYRSALLCASRALALPYADHPDYREEWRP